MAEIFFGITTRQAIRRGSFTSVKGIITAIRAFIDGWHDRCHPFTWTKTTDQILEHATPTKLKNFIHETLGHFRRYNQCDRKTNDL